MRSLVLDLLALHYLIPGGGLEEEMFSYQA